MTDLDLLLRGGLVVDGSGGDPFVADVAISSGRIVEVGRIRRRARHEIDAKGLLVTPGFVDIHTHYDGQVTWTDRVTPSSKHGVTTAMFGNCGVGFAPCRTPDRDRLVRLMEGVEDIPGSVLADGLPWNWTSFPDYLDALSARAFDIDIAAQLPHAPLRVFVMGQRAADREPATDADIAAMAQIAREAIAAGAFGFSTSRSINHRASDGSHTPSLTASARELSAIAEAVGGTGRGVLQMICDFEEMERDFDLVRTMAQRSRRPLSLSLVQLPHAPDRWREILAHIEQENRDGLDIRAQVCGRPIGLFLGFDLSYCPFSFCPSYQSLAGLAFEERILALREPERRRRILEEFAVPLQQRGAEIERAFASRTVDSFSMARLLTDFGGMYELGDPPEYEPPANSSIAAIAAQRGSTPAEIAFDLLLARDGQALIYVPAANYAHRSLDDVREMLTHGHTILGLGDGGAHCSLICDASFPTWMLTHWTRDRNRGLLPLPRVVQALTSQCARAVGFRDRGLIAPGYRADINLIDFARLRLHPPRVTHDLPGGGKRLNQDADGYVLTVVNGVPTGRDGIATGEMPGRLVRLNEMRAAAP